MDRLDEEYHNIRAALYHNAFCCQHYFLPGYCLLNVMRLFWSNRNYYREGLRQLGALPSIASDQVREILQAEAWNCAGLWAWSQGNTSKAIACFLKAKRAWKSVLAVKTKMDSDDAQHSREYVSANGTQDEEELNCWEHSHTPLGCRIMSTNVCKLKYVEVLSYLVYIHTKLEESMVAEKYVNESNVLLEEVGHQEACRIRKTIYLSSLMAEHWEAADYFAEILTVQVESGSCLDLSWCLEGVAQLAAIQDESVLSTRLFGAARQAKLVAQGPSWCFTRRQWDHIHDELRRRLGNTSYEAEWERGMALDYTEAIEMAIDFCPRQ